MKQKSIFSILLVFLSTVGFSQSEESGKLDSLFTVLYNQNQFNGSILIAEKGKVIFEKGYGLRNEESKKKITPNTIFELASCSKQFTAAAIVLLNREGKLTYSDTISKYLPELGFWGDVTIHDLLRHTSGIPEYLFDMQEEWDHSKIATNEDVIRFYASRKDSLEFKPTSQHRYCNTNYALLASIIERVSGTTYADFMRNNIFRPLRMKSTCVYNRRENPRKLKNHATGYVWATGSFDKVTRENPRYDDKTVYYFDGIVGTAKVNSTVRDLYTWINALKSNTFFTQEEFEQMTEVTETPGGKKIWYGFGLDLSKGENKFSYGHTGSWDGYSTFTYHNQIKDRTIIILQNFHFGAFSFDNISQVLDHEPIILEYKQKIQLSESEMQPFVGQYVDPENEEEKHIITYEGGHLIYNSSSVNWDMRFMPVSKTEFQAIRQGGMDGVLKFTHQEDGTLKLEMLEYGEAIGFGIREE